MIPISVWGDDLDGAKWNNTRGHSMTKTAPPADYKWHHYKVNANVGTDSTVSPLVEETRALYREIRQEWLDQWELEVVEEGKYRVWRWLGGVSTLRGAYVDSTGTPREVKWMERRSTNSPLPKVPGLWPSDE